MSRKLNKVLLRYRRAEIVEHLAYQYVLGQLSTLVSKRVERLIGTADYPELNKAVVSWENSLSSLNEKTPEVEPYPETWHHIQKRLNMLDTDQDKNATFITNWLALIKQNWFASASFASCVVLVMLLIVQAPSQDSSLSYVAVLQDSQNQAQIVAATYGDSKRLVLDIIDLPAINDDETFELWVASKTDKQLRSLGEIPVGTNAFERQLTLAEWRLIIDSSYLVVSLEEEGGSAIGEPSEQILSKGLCVRLSAWEVSS